jgi:hypothetical protein
MNVLVVAARSGYVGGRLRMRQHSGSKSHPGILIVTLHTEGVIIVIERNGVSIFDMNEKNEDHRAFKELRKVSLGDVRFPFGFFLIDEGGKTYVLPGTEEDRRKTMLKAFPNINPEAFLQGCHPNAFGSGCHGGCGKMSPGFKCKHLFDNDRRFFGCGCVDVS